MGLCSSSLRRFFSFFFLVNVAFSRFKVEKRSRIACLVCSFDMLFANVLPVSNMEHFVRLYIQITKLVYNGLN